MKDTGRFLVELEDGTEATCWFTTTGATLNILGTPIDINGSFEYGDTHAVVDAMNDHMAEIDRQLAEVARTYRLH